MGVNGMKKDSLWRGKKKRRRVIFLELLFDRITRRKRLTCHQGRALIGRNLCKSASDVFD